MNPPELVWSWKPFTFLPCCLRLSLTFTLVGSSLNLSSYLWTFMRKKQNQFRLRSHRILMFVLRVFSMSSIFFLESPPEGAERIRVTQRGHFKSIKRIQEIVRAEKPSVEVKGVFSLMTSPKWELCTNRRKKCASLLNTSHFNFPMKVSLWSQNLNPRLRCVFVSAKFFHKLRFSNSCDSCLCVSKSLSFFIIISAALKIKTDWCGRLSVINETDHWYLELTQI